MTAYRGALLVSTRINLRARINLAKLRARFTFLFRIQNLVWVACRFRTLVLPLFGDQNEPPENPYLNNQGMIGVDMVQALVFFVHIVRDTKRWNSSLLDFVDGSTSAELQRRITAKRLKQIAE